MALSSMTGFARAASALDGWRLAFEWRSVNGRGLDVRLRLPPSFEGLEPALRTAVGSALGRGTVNGALAAVREGGAQRPRIDVARAAQLLAELAEVPRPPGIAPPSLDAILALPGIVSIDEADTAPSEAVRGEAARLAEAALHDLASVRRSEGSALREVIADHLDHVERLVAAARAAPGRQPAAVAERLRRQLSELLGAEPRLDAARLHAEAMLALLRSDVAEELDRLDAHVAAARALVGPPTDRAGPTVATAAQVGRRLDFLAQELAREANTVCAKAGDVEMSAIGLDLKTRVERLREQVQNVE